MDEDNTEWKTAVYYNNKLHKDTFSLYVVNASGKVRHYKKFLILKVHVNKDKYAMIQLKHIESRKHRGLLIHRLVASTFLGEPTDAKMTVDHIDGNLSNNHVSNLRWVDTKTQLENRTIINAGKGIPVCRIAVATNERVRFKSQCHVPGVERRFVSQYIQTGRVYDGYRYEIDKISVIEGEIWKVSYDSRYITEVSNLGRVRRYYPQRECYYEVHSRQSNGYKMAAGPSGKEYRLHRIVAHLFHGLDLNDSSAVVNHLSEDATCNESSNLEVTNAAENTRYSQSFIYRVTHRETNEVIECDGTILAALIVECPRNYISYYARGIKVNKKWNVEMIERLVVKKQRTAIDLALLSN